MNTPSLPFDQPVPARKPKHHVQRTSVLSYVNERLKVDTVKMRVLRALLPPAVCPTGLELAKRMGHSPYHVRTALSMLKQDGLVENGPNRPCRISGKTVKTWRVTSR